MPRGNPNRRNTRGNARNDAPPTPPTPNSSDAMRQIFIEMMPELVTATVQAMNASIGSPAGNRHEPVREEEPEISELQKWMEKFHKHKPQSFSRAANPVESQHWIKHLEKIFRIMGCPDGVKVRLAEYKLQNEADEWWTRWKLDNGAEEALDDLTWSEFKLVFLNQYFPSSDKEAMLRQYNDLKQGEDEPITDYIPRFRKLLSQAGTDAGSTERVIRKFCWSVNRKFRVHLIEKPYIDLAQAENAAKNYFFESQMEDPKPKAEHVQTFKRKEFDQPPSRFADKRSRTDFRDQRNVQQPLTIATAPRGPQPIRMIPGSTTICSLCKREHKHGECYQKTGACFKCGKQGHQSRQCPLGQLPAIASTSQGKGKGKMT